MGWFDNQIKTRREADQQLLDDSFIKVAEVIMGRSGAEKLGDERIITKNAIDDIPVRFFALVPREVHPE